MHHKLTIFLDSQRKVSSLVKSDLESDYLEMKENRKREAEAEAWSENLIVDFDDGDNPTK